MSTAAKVLFSAVKNEAPFILEWLAYHRAIGFGQFYICSNDSDDGTTELLDALSAAGEIVHLQNAIRPGELPQRVAAQRFRDESLPREGDWVIWLDADEFLNIHVGSGRVDDLIDYLGDHQGILIPWRLFGDAGASGLPERLASGRFVRAANHECPEQAEIKTFFRMSDCVAGFGYKSLHRPVIKRDQPNVLNRFITGGGAKPDPDFKVHSRWARGDDSAKSCRIPPKEVSWEVAQINHYAVRSPAMLKLKQARGRGYAPHLPGKSNDRHTPEFYDLMNRNECEDRSILKHEQAVTDELSRLMAVEDVRAAHEEGLRRTAEKLRAIEAAEVELDEATDTPAPKKEGFVLTLPEVEAEMLRSVLGPDRVILEYGSGGSTFEALRRGAAMVYSVESDAKWAKQIDADLADMFSRDRFSVIYSDIGPTKAWGRPVDNRSAGKFHLYPLSVWDLPDFRQPDVILIDGRFRAACFATAAMRLTRPATVLFDDYEDRTYYHWVEEICAPAKMVGRMAVFHLEPAEIPKTLLTRVAGAFADSR